MKKQLKLTSLLMSLFFLFLVSCEDDNDIDETLPTEEAKDELRDADQNLSNEMSNMMASDAFTSMEFLMGLTESDPYNMEALKDLTLQATPEKFFKEPLFISSEPITTKVDEKQIDPTEDTGIYYFSFVEYTFILEDGEVDYLELNFPANETAFENEENNAALRIDDLEVDVFDNEEVLTFIVLSLSIDNETVLTLNYDVQFTQINDEPMPTSGTIDLDLPPYNFLMTFTASETDASISMSWTTEDKTLTSADLHLEGNLYEDETPEKVEGNIIPNPIKYEGDAYPLAIEEHLESVDAGEEELDIDYLNDRLNIDVIHTERNKKLGHLEFYAAYDNAEPELYVIIVFEDEEWNYLEDIMPALAAMFDDMEGGADF